MQYTSFINKGTLVNIFVEAIRDTINDGVHLEAGYDNVYGYAYDQVMFTGMQGEKYEQWFKDFSLKVFAYATINAKGWGC
jgi:hypothetical protein